MLRNLSISIFRQPGHALEPLASGRLYTSPKRKRGGLRESSQEHRRRRIERPPGCPRHSRPIRTPSLALRAGIPDPTTTGERNTKKRKRGGPRESSQEDRRRRIERPPGCPRHSRPIRTPSLALRAGIPDPTTTGERNTKKRKRGGPRESSQEDRRRRIERPPGCPRHSRPIRTPSLALRAGIPDPTTTGERNTKKRKRGGPRRARRNTGADVLRDLQVVRVTPGRSGPPRSRFGLVFQTRPRLVSATPKNASEGVCARARRNTGADVLRDLQVVRVTPGRSAPPRSRFGLVFQTRPRLVSATPKSASEGVLRRRSQEHRRRRIERPPGCPRHSRPIRTPSLALWAGIPDPTTTGERNTKKRKRGGPRRARRKTGADVLRDLQVVRVTPGRSGPPRLRFGLVFQTRPRLVSATPKSASEGVRARARRKTGADVLRDLQVVRVTPGRSGPPRLRFGLVFQTRPRLVSATPKNASEGVRECSQEDRRRRIERPPGCPRHARPIRTPSLALRAGIPDPTTTGERNTKNRKRGGPRNARRKTGADVLRDLQVVRVTPGRSGPPRSRFGLVFQTRPRLVSATPKLAPRAGIPIGRWLQPRRKVAAPWQQLPGRVFEGFRRWKRLCRANLVTSCAATSERFCAHSNA